MDIDDFLRDEMKKEEMRKFSGTHIVSKETEVTPGINIYVKLEKIRALMEAGSYKEAGKLYADVKEDYANITRVQLEERRKLFEQMQYINRELIKKLNDVRLDMDRKIATVRELLAKATTYLENRELDKANELYSEIRSQYSSLPDAFSEEKLVLENEILSFYSRLIAAFNKNSYAKIRENTERIKTLLNQAYDDIKTGKTEEAIGKYDEIMKLYEGLPPGYLYEKSVLYQSILDLHHQLTFTAKVESLNVPAQAEATEAPQPLEEKPKPKKKKTAKK